MKRIVAAAILLGSLGQAESQFDLSAEFSFQKNPNQQWQYGYSATHSLDPTEFRLDEYANPAGAIGFWHPAATDKPGPGYYPYIAFNQTRQSQYGSSNGWAARPGE